MNRKNTRTIHVDGVNFVWRLNERCLSLVFEGRFCYPLRYPRVVLHFPKELYHSHICDPRYLTPRYIARLIRMGVSLGWPTFRKTGPYRAWFALMEEHLVELAMEACDGRIQKRKKYEAMRKSRTELLQVLCARKEEVLAQSSNFSSDCEAVLFEEIT